jgi:hypothetical protein
MFDISKEYKFVNGALIVLFIIAVSAPFAVSIPGLFNNSFPLQWKPPDCFIKQQTGKPCPTCGLTRSVVALYNGNWNVSQHYYPKGYLIICLILFEICLRVVINFSKSGWAPWLDIGQFLLIGYLLKLLYF